MLKDAETHDINYLESAVFINKGNGKFLHKPFPARAQLSAVNTILAEDINGDGNKEIILAGNFYGFKPEVGRLDASYGDVYRYNKDSFNFVPASLTGFKINGQVRSSIVLKNKAGGKYYLFGRNNDSLISFQVN